MLDEALRLSELGLAVHFLRSPQGGDEKGRGKAPIHAGWQKRGALTESELRHEYRTGCNLGLHCGHVVGAAVPIVAIDCDGWGAVDYLRLRGVLPTPVKTRTRKGFHLIYRHPGVTVATRLKVDGQPVDTPGVRFVQPFYVLREDDSSATPPDAVPPPQAQGGG